MWKTNRIDITIAISYILVIVFGIMVCIAGIQACNRKNTSPNRIYTVVLSTGEVTRWILPKDYNDGDTVHLTYRNGTKIIGVIEHVYSNH